jgi:hypothetical protein
LALLDCNLLPKELQPKRRTEFYYKRKGTNTTANNKNKPCVNAESFGASTGIYIWRHLLPQLPVMGIAPNSPHSILPTPCAISSLLTGVIRFLLSNLSIASVHNKVSREAKSPINTPSFQISIFENSFEKSGKEILPKMFSGIATN